MGSTSSPADEEPPAEEEDEEALPLEQPDSREAPSARARKREKSRFLVIDLDPFLALDEDIFYTIPQNSNRGKSDPASRL